MGEEYERRIAALPPIADPSGAGEWTTVLSTVSDLIPALREAGAVACFEEKPSGISGDPNKWVQNQHRFTRIHVERKQFHFLSDEDWTLITNILMPTLRALRIDDLVVDWHFQGEANGRRVCNMDWRRGRGLHYFAPLECFSTALVRLELRGTDSTDDDSVVSLHAPKLYLDKLTSLRYLKLANFLFGTDEDVRAFGSCKQLQHLVFECCGWDMKDAEEKLSEALSQTNNLVSFSNIGTSSYRTGRSEPQPRGFCFRSTRFHLELGHGQELRSLPDLPDSVEEIDASCATAIGLAHYMRPAIAPSAMTKVPSSLRRINLAYCPFIENDTIKLIGSTPGCQQRLEHVNLNGTNVTDVSPLLMCKRLNVLEIRFSACSDPRLDQEWKEKQQDEGSSPLCIYWKPARPKDLSASAEEETPEESRNEKRKREDE